jgi:hypothetical protein
VTVIAAPDQRESITGVLFTHTTTIGVRYQEMRRDTLDRKVVSVETPLGPLRVKVAGRDGRVLNAAAEFDDCARVAGERGLPIKEVQAIAMRAWARSKTLMSRFYLTTAIDYVNSRPHLGTAYEKIAADVIARYKRLCGIDTHFVMGNDEHSQNVFRRARELGQDPLAYCESHGGRIPRGMEASRSVVRRLHPHDGAAAQSRCQELVRRMSAAGDIFEGFYEGWYCVACEAFKQEKDLIDGNCPIHRTKPEWIREKNHFFKLSKYTDRLRQHFESHADFLVARRQAQRDSSAARGRARRHFSKPRRSGVGHSDARRSIERHLRVGGRADQLPQCGRVWDESGMVANMVAGGFARHRQGHHPISRSDLAGNVDERWPGRAKADLRAWMGELSR